jgi:hypothetical protein
MEVVLEELTTLTKQIVDREPGGMEAPDIAELAFHLLSVIVFKSPPEKREAVIAQLGRGSHAAMAEGKRRGALRDEALKEATKATKQ